MGNLLQTIFGGNANTRHKCSFKKLSKHSKRNAEHTDVNGDIKTKTDDHQPANIDELEKNMNETNQSPFKRDFYPPPHEMLVPLEKYRPRRSNVRRSTRQNASITNSNNSTSCNNNNNINNISNDNDNNNNNNNNAEQNESKLYENGNVSIKNDNEPNCDESLVNKIPSLVEEDEIEMKEEMEINENEIKMENSTPSLTYIDKLDPSERTKLARSKISELFNKVPPTMAQRNSSIKDRKYQSVYEPTMNHYLDNVENEQNNAATIMGPSENNDNECILRPKKPHIKGNALLIDELKKRQTNYYESRQISSVELTN